MNKAIKHFMRVATALLLLPAFLFAMSATTGATYAQTGAMAASAQIMDQAGKQVGTANFVETNGGVQVTVQVSGLTTAPAGEHGIHIHQTGSCVEPDFSSAGEHFNPLAKEHGMDNPYGPHAGDLTNIVFDAGGNATYQTTDTMVTLSPGVTSLFDTDGSSIVIHANPDDYMTGPSGKSGPRIACGVIVMSNVVVGMPSTGQPGSGPQSVLPIATLAALAALAVLMIASGLLMARRRTTGAIHVESGAEKRAG